MSTRIVVAILAVFVSTGLHAAEEQRAPDPKPQRNASVVRRAGKEKGKGQKVRLVILSGQSNMAALPEQLSVVPKLAAAYPDDELILVKHSLSGQPIRRWAKEWVPVGDWRGRSARDKPGNNDLYRALMGMVKEAAEGRALDSVSFLWMQGEADAKSGQSAQYADALRGLIGQLRADLGREDVAAVVGRISDHLSGDAHWDAVRAAQVEVADADPLVEWVDTDDLNGPRNGLHYDLKGYNELGARFVEKLAALVPRDASPSSSPTDASDQE